MRVAFFDLDRTLLADNSAVLWIRSERRNGRISSWELVRAASWLLRYRLGVASMDDALRQAIATLEGESAEQLRERTEAFYQQHVRGRFRPGGLAALEEHRRKGERCTLLTSSTSYLAEPVARELGLDDVLCNRLEVDARGFYTGRSQGELCYGEGKLAQATEYTRRLGVSWDACVFYTDSFSDMPVLQVVGSPVAVNPDLRLKRTARRLGWPVVDWGEPVRQPTAAAAL
jgi:HAD superfamily hydrolase (TIGR01490 family)